MLRRTLKRNQICKNYLLKQNNLFFTQHKLTILKLLTNYCIKKCIDHQRINLFNSSLKKIKYSQILI